MLMINGLGKNNFYHYDSAVSLPVDRISVKFFKLTMSVVVNR